MSAARRVRQALVDLPDSTAFKLAAEADCSESTARMELVRCVRAGLANRYRFGNDPWRYLPRPGIGATLGAPGSDTESGER